ncbi:MAG: mechanosensitive ion channel [Proteobacteria bacterium]|nr:mechanosensitive ion channel [Pseudomonadota bacterium]
MIILNKSLQFLSIIVPVFIVISLFTAPSHGNPEENFLQSAGLSMVESTHSNSSIQHNPWLSNTFSHLSEAVRLRTSEIVVYVEKIAALPGYLNTIIEQNNKKDILKKVGMLSYKIIVSLFIAFLSAFFISFIQKKVFQRFKSLPPLWSSLGSIFLSPLSFFIIGFISLSLFIENTFFRSFFIDFITLITALWICLSSLNYFDRTKPSSELISSLTLPLRSLIYWIWSFIALNVLLKYAKVPSLLSGIFFGILGFIIFSLFTNFVLKLRPAFDTWIKQKNILQRFHLTSPFFQFLADHCHLFVIGSGFFIYLSWTFKEDTRTFFIRIFSSFLIIILIQLSFLLWHFLLKLWTDTDSLLSRFDPIYSRHITKSLHFMGWLFHAFFYGIGFVLIGKVWKCDLIGWIDETFQTKSLNITIDISITLILGILIWQLTEALFEKYLQSLSQRLKGSQREKNAQMQRLRTILPVFQNGLRWILSSILLLMMLAQAGVDTTPLLTGLGIFGLALSFGSQSLVKDFINGLNILLDGSLNIGDVVLLGNCKGVVENLTLRNVELRDIDTGAIHIVPFSQVEIISNFSKEYTFCSFEVEVLESEDLNLVSTTIQNVLKEMMEDPTTKDMVLSEATIWGIKRMDGLKIAIDGRFKSGVYISGNVKSEFNKRLQQACKLNKINLSSPAEIVYLSSMKNTFKGEPL